MANIEPARGFTVGILTVSDTSSKDPTKDLSGPSLKNVFLESKKAFNVVKTKIVPDEFEEIQNTVRQWCDTEKLDLIVTTGGTGFGVRDVTPEAIQPLLHKLCPGITQKMMQDSLQRTPFAALSRLISGIRGGTIILAVPGSLKGSKENVEAVIGILPHAIDLARGGTGENVHSQLRDHQGAGDVHHKHASRSFLSNPLSGSVTQRQRKSPYQMITVKEALGKIAEYASTLSTVTVPVNQDLVGAVLAENVIAKEPVPGYRASIVDGYAVIASDGPGTYPVVGVSVASGGSESLKEELKPGQVTRITTGGPVPPGATAVVMVEDTTLVRASADGHQEMEVQIHIRVRDNENIREIGSDLNVGMIVARKGELVTAVGGEIGVLASAGVKEVQIYKRPVIGIVSTGNEIVEHNDPSELKYGTVRDSNRPALLAIAKSTGFEVRDFGIVRDDPKKLEHTLRTALSQVNVLVTTGGVSMGEFDLLKPTLEQSLGATIHFGRVKMKPGKPTTFATVPSDLPNGPQKMVFALPGNPVSAVVTFYLFVLPTLRKISGYENWILPVLQAELTNDIPLDPRPEYYRAIISYDRTKGKLLASSTGRQRSSRILSVRSCNSLLILPGKTDELSKLLKGTTVDAILIGQLY